MKTSSYLLSMSLIFISITMSLVSTSTTHAMSVPTSSPDGKDAGGTFGKYFSGLKNTTACTSPFMVSGFDPNTKIPNCKTQSAFIKEYFGSQSSVVPPGNVVTGFDPSTGKMISNSANTMIAGVFIGMSDGGSMEALIGYDISGPVYSRNVGYWLDNGGAGIRYVGPVKVGGGFLGGGMTVNSVSSPTDATANNHLMRKGQFLSLMKTLCENNIKGTWDGTNCIPKNCTSTPWGTINHGASQIGYKESSVDYPGSCVSESRLCDNGKLSGTYTNTSCSVKHTYDWEVSEYGICSKDCGGGKATRTVECKRDDGVLAKDVFCNWTKPTTTTDCNTQACEVGPTCDDGIRNQGETKVDCGGPNCGACSVTPPTCIPNGSCSAAAPACGQTTTGVDNCGNSCEKTGGACACVSNGSCSAAAPACGQTTTGVDNCGNSCEKTGGACPVSCTPTCGSYCVGATRYYKPCATCEWNFVICEANGSWRIYDH